MNQMNPEWTTAFGQVKRFVEMVRGPANFLLLDTTTLEKDLRISGDDGQEFMEAFFKEFSVDVNDFDCSRYFVPEGFDLTGLTILIRKLLKQPPLRAPVHDINLADLARAVLDRKWVDPTL